MNQILSFQTSAGGRKILFKNTKNLCIFLIIFAIALICSGGYRLYVNINKEADIAKPVIVGHINGNKTTFNIKSNIGLQKIIYAWNNGEDCVITSAGEHEKNIEIDNRIGVNELKLKIIDSDNNTITYDNIKIVYDEDSSMLINDDNQQNQTISLEEALKNDKTPPVISLSAETATVVVDAIDDLKMSYILYSWNGGEETKVTGLSEDERTLTAKIDALKGYNKIKIKAYDLAGNVKEIEKEVHGTGGPKIAVTREDDQIVVNVTSEYGITKIEYDFNEEVKTIDNIEGNTYELRLDLVDGVNYIVMSAYEGSVKAEYKGKTTK
ncbi:MAG: hypothetical protein IKE01_05400 [Clostridia bacterium]|nr:hypothetical protein [Clostridia bacterium]